MLRQTLTRPGGLALTVVVIGLACLTTSCGGGGGYAAKEMVLMEFLFVDRGLVPTAPTGTSNLPRNAQILLVFSEQVDPKTVNPQTVQVRFGPSGQSVPKGSYAIDGNTIRFDPTVTAQGQPNPFGFDPVTQYIVDIPNFEEQDAVVNNLDADPNLETFFTTFVTSDAFIRELDPPEVVQVYSIPDNWVTNPSTGQFPGNGICAIEFNEPMAPASFLLGTDAGPDAITSVDVRYVASEVINRNNGLVDLVTNVGTVIPGSFTHDAGATTYYFNPTFSFGTKNYVFTVQVFQGLEDLSGNLLVNPRSFGPFTVDATGIQTGRILLEDFTSTANYDIVSSDSPDWGIDELGVLEGDDISSREVWIHGFTYEDVSATNADRGQYAAIISPMIGASLNQWQTGISPPTEFGRRAMWAFSDVEMGENGAVTGAAWGPDSNATFAAIYPKIFLRCGYQKTASMSLSPSFAGNYDGNPTVVYTGDYQVPQAANVGNVIDNTGLYCFPIDLFAAYNCPICNQTCIPTGWQQQCNWNQPLWDSTGFQAWPEFTTYFEWNEGDPNTDNDSVFLFDASVSEGDAWQQVRGWFGSTFPCSGVLITGFPNRRMYTTYEDDVPDPPASFSAGILNPEPSITDTAFTVTKRMSMAQSLFWVDVSLGIGSPPFTFGAVSDYLPVQLTPIVQSGGTEVRIEFQGAHGCAANRRDIDTTLGPATDWSDIVDTCDGFECIRWRIWLISNLLSSEKPRLYQVEVPVVDTYVAP